MAKIKFYKKDNGSWKIGDLTQPAGTCYMRETPVGLIAVLRLADNSTLAEGIFSDFTDAAGVPYATYAAFEAATQDFFVKASEQQYLIEVSEAINSYGVIFDQNLSTTTLYRIGNQELHRTLPVQSGMRRC